MEQRPHSSTVSSGKRTSLFVIVAGCILLATILVGWAANTGAQKQRQREEKAQLFAVYQPYGLTYDAKADRLLYQGQQVRYFEDFIAPDSFTEWPQRDGAVDVYAVRDETGALVGVVAFDQQAFTERTSSLQDAVCELQITESIDGYTGAVEAQVKDSIAAAYAVYEPYGLTYDPERDRLYYGGELVGYFEDADLHHTFGPFDDSALVLRARRDQQGRLTGLDVDGQNE